MQARRCLHHWSIDDSARSTLFYSSPHIGQMLVQIIHILHFCQVDSMLNYDPDLIVNWIEAKVV